MHSPLEVTNEEFSVRNLFWDRNFSSNALEVVDEKGQVIFQMIRESESKILINGIFPLPDGTFLIADDTDMRRTAKPELPSVKVLFKYPSWKYPNQYAD